MLPPGFSDRSERVIPMNQPLLIFFIPVGSPKFHIRNTVFSLLGVANRKFAITKPAEFEFGNMRDISCYFLLVILPMNFHGISTKDFVFCICGLGLDTLAALPTRPAAIRTSSRARDGAYRDGRLRVPSNALRWNLETLQLRCVFPNGSSAYWECLPQPICATSGNFGAKALRT